MRDNLSYLAGIIDGEGSINARFQRGGPAVSAQITVGQVDRRLISWLHETWGGNAYWRETSVSTWVLPVATKRDLCEALHPLMIVKGEQLRLALLLLDLCSSSFRGRSGVPPQNFEERRRLLSLIRDEKDRGSINRGL